LRLNGSIKERRNRFDGGLLNIIGTIAFAISGVLIVLEEDNDILAVYFLGFMTAF